MAEQGKMVMSAVGVATGSGGQLTGNTVKLHKASYGEMSWAFVYIKG